MPVLCILSEDLSVNNLTFVVVFVLFMSLDSLVVLTSNRCSLDVVDKVFKLLLYGNPCLFTFLYFSLLYLCCVFVLMFLPAVVN